MVRPWLSITKFLEGLRRTDAPIPVRETDKPFEEKPIHITGEFLKAKRNLLWFSSAAILLFFAALSQFDVSNSVEPNKAENVTIALTGLQVNRKILGILIVLYNSYILYGFWYYAQRVTRINSKAYFTDEFSAVNDHLRVTEQAIHSLAKFFDSKNSMILKLNDEFYEIMRSEIKRMTDEAKSKREQAERAYESVWKFFGKPLSEIKNDFEGQNGGRFADEFSYMHDSLDTSHSVVIELSQYLEHYMKEAADIEQDFDKSRFLESLNSIVDLNKSFGELSEQINGGDKFKFNYHDKFTAYAMYGFSSVLSVVGLSDVAMKYLATLL